MIRLPLAQAKDCVRMTFCTGCTGGTGWGRLAPPLPEVPAGGMAEGGGITSVPLANGPLAQPEIAMAPKAAAA